MRRLSKPLTASLFEEEPQLAPGEKKKRKKPVMLTGRSRKYLERQGFIVALVERTVDVPRFDKGKPTGERFRNKFDCFGFADFCCARAGMPGVLFVQVTDHSHHAERREKIIAAKAAPILLASGNGIQVHSWSSQKPRGRPKLWRLRIQEAGLVERGTKVGFRDSENKFFTEDMEDYGASF